MVVYENFQNFLSKARLKKVLIDKHNEIIYDSVRSKGSSCIVHQCTFTHTNGEVSV